MNIKEENIEKENDLEKAFKVLEKGCINFTEPNFCGIFHNCVRRV